MTWASPRLTGASAATSAKPAARSHPRTGGSAANRKMRLSELAARVVSRANLSRLAD